MLTSSACNLHYCTPLYSLTPICVASERLLGHVQRWSKMASGWSTNSKGEGFESPSLSAANNDQHALPTCTPTTPTGRCKRAKKHHTHRRALTDSSIFHSRLICTSLVTHAPSPLLMVLRGYQFGHHAVGPTGPPKARAAGGAFNGKRRVLFWRF